MFGFRFLLISIRKLHVHSIPKELITSVHVDPLLLKLMPACIICRYTREGYFIHEIIIFFSFHHLYYFILLLSLYRNNVISDTTLTVYRGSGGGGGRRAVSAHRWLYGSLSWTVVRSLPTITLIAVSLIINKKVASLFRVIDRNCFIAVWFIRWKNNQCTRCIVGPRRKGILLYVYMIAYYTCARISGERWLRSCRYSSHCVSVYVRRPSVLKSSLEKRNKLIRISLY
jgi:hypothetical protein